MGRVRWTTEHAGIGVTRCRHRVLVLSRSPARRGRRRGQVAARHAPALARAFGQGGRGKSASRVAASLQERRVTPILRRLSRTTTAGGPAAVAGRAGRQRGVPEHGRPVPDPATARDGGRPLVPSSSSDAGDPEPQRHPESHPRGPRHARAPAASHCVEATPTTGLRASEFALVVRIATLLSIRGRTRAPRAFVFAAVRGRG